MSVKKNWLLSASLRLGWNRSGPGNRMADIRPDCKRYQLCSVERKVLSEGNVVTVRRKNNSLAPLIFREEPWPARPESATRPRVAGQQPD